MSSVSYHYMVFAITKVIILMVAGFAVLWTALAVADVLLSLGWGYTWEMIPLGPLLLLGAYLLYRFIEFIKRSIDSIQSR